MRKYITGIFVVVTLLMLAINAEAFLPTGIEDAIRSWFSSAGKLIQLTFSPSTPQTSLSGQCRWSMDRATNNLVASCDGSAQRILVNTADLGCVENASGDLSCASFTSGDQNDRS